MQAYLLSPLPPFLPTLLPNGLKKKKNTKKTPKHLGERAIKRWYGTPEAFRSIPYQTGQDVSIYGFLGSKLKDNVLAILGKTTLRICLGLDILLLPGLQLLFVILLTLLACTTRGSLEGSPPPHWTSHYS